MCLCYLGGGFQRWKKILSFLCVSQHTHQPRCAPEKLRTLPTSTLFATPALRSTWHRIADGAPGPEGAQLQQAVLFTRGQRHPRLRQRELQGHPGPRKPSATLCCQAESREIVPKTLLPALDPTWRPLPTREAGTGSEDLECPSSLLLLEPCSRARSGPAPAEKSGHVGEEKLWSVTSSWTSLCTGGSPNPHDLGAPWLLAHPLAPGWSSVNATS